MIQVTPVILCGGSGTRLWPLSRTGFPKQFLCLTGNESLFQQAAQRLTGLASESIQLVDLVIVSGEEHRFLAAEQLRESGIALGTALLEPIGRNTAPALTLAALAAMQDGLDPVLVVTPADQTVANAPAFALAMQQAITEAAQGSIVILGVTPNKPETGYGYIQTDGGIADPSGSEPPLANVCKVLASGGLADSSGSEPLLANICKVLASGGIANPSGSEPPLANICKVLASGGLADPSGSEPLLANICKVLAFVEKPKLETAEKYLAEGGYFWNAGMFVLKASVWLAALQKFAPTILQKTHAAWACKTQDTNFVRPGKAEFSAIPSESVDYAVMEHCPGSDFVIKMIPLDAGWNDLGAWDAVWNVQQKDVQGNAHKGDVMTTDSRNTLVHATSRLVSLVGVDNLVVIETADAVLVADKSRSQDVKAIVNSLIQQKREEQTLHRKVHRPWGWYDSIDEGPRFKVKRILVKPKASLSLQKHHHRAEHWIVVTGTAEITNGDKVLTLTENQSTYIPLGEVHRLANPGTIPLEIIEVQSGSYLGEDDIVRFEDTYGRVQS